MNVAFRVDASAEMGTGHFMRCLSLADGLRRHGASIRFVSRQLPEQLRDMLADRTYELAPLDAKSAAERAGDLTHSRWLGATQAADAQATIAALSPHTWHWLVVDHYALDARWESALRSRATRILAIDDLADRRHDCDVLLDQNSYPDKAQRYTGKVPPHCLLLFGPGYALLREEFRRARRNVSPRTGSVARVLVSFGGIDAANWTGVAIEALLACGRSTPKADVVIGAHHVGRSEVESACQRHGFLCHVQTNRMAELMAGADLAIGAGGVTTWERCCMGLPALAVSVAVNQNAMVAGVALEGLLYTPGDRELTASGLAVHLRALLDNPRLLEMISRNGMRAVDGRGVERVLRVLDQCSLAIREATCDDAEALFAWRNHESVRSMSRHSDEIAWPDHRAWLSRVLADPARLLLIGEREGVPVGVVRFDVNGYQAEVSIYRVPGAGEPGIGTSLLLAAEAWLRAKRPDVTSLTAEVLEDNQRSQRLFQSAMYQPHSSVYTKTLHVS